MLVLETVIFVILYMVYHTLWLHIATHSLHWHTEYVTPSSSDHTGTTSSIDAVPSYLVGYEGRRLGICTILLFPWLLHCIGIWSYVAASIRDRTCTTSFIGHNDATSYIVWYEGRRHGIRIAYALWFWIMVYMFWIQNFGEILRSNLLQGLLVIGIYLAYEVLVWFVISHGLSLVYLWGIALA